MDNAISANAMHDAGRGGAAAKAGGQVAASLNYVFSSRGAPPLGFATMNRYGPYNVVLIKGQPYDNLPLSYNSSLLIALDPYSAPGTNMSSVSLDGSGMRTLYVMSYNGGGWAGNMYISNWSATVRFENFVPWGTLGLARTEAVLTNMNAMIWVQNRAGSDQTVTVYAPNGDIWVENAKQASATIRPSQVYGFSVGSREGGSQQLVLQDGSGQRTGVTLQFTYPPM